jgi:hypothetical protein
MTNAGVREMAYAIHGELTRTIEIENAMCFRSLWKVSHRFLLANTGLRSR